MPTAKDFTASAENLVNPDEVKLLLDYLHQAEAQLKTLQDTLEEANAELVCQIRTKQAEVSALELDLKGDPKQGIVGAIEKHGSYQDTELEHYAVRYRRMIKDYHPEPLIKHFPKFADLCIVAAVNVAALTGQVKGGLLTEAELKKKGVITEEAQIATYIR